MNIDLDELLREREERPVRRGRWWWVIAILIFLLFVAGGAVIELVTEWQWFGTLGLTSVIRTRVVAPLAIFLGMFLLAFIWFAANWLIALRGVSNTVKFPGQRSPTLSAASARPVVVGVAAVMAGLLAAGAAAQWQAMLLYLNRVPFGVSEPILGRDVSFYVFELPILTLLRSLAVSALVTALVGTAVVYVFGGLLDLKIPSGPSGVSELRQKVLRIPTAVRTHIWVLAALLALLWAVGQWLARYALLFTRTPGGAFFGPGYADVTARLPAYSALAVIGVLVAVVILLNSRGGRTWLLIGVLVLAFFLRVGLLGVWPSVLQRFKVDPNELNIEQPFITNNIELTRVAFGLEDVVETEYDPSAAVTSELIAEHESTLENVRLWDWRMLIETFRQLQEIRAYYDFLDVDVDRYHLESGQRQVELSIRELTPSQLPNPTWVNTHLEYTHGFGVVMAPVNEADRNGTPVLWVRDIPPATSPPFDREVTQPRIYVGEAAGDGYVIVNTDTQEFDYPVGAQNVRNTYDGADGVVLSSLLRRLIYAVRFGDSEILFSGNLNPGSRIIFHRNIADRVSRLAPFLTLDPDPYLIVTDEGRLVWVYDAYTTTSLFPYSQPVSASELEFGDGGRTGLGGQNYIRNSVKVAIDAYDGTPSFYVVDDEDPLIEAWRSVFPDLFLDATAAPADLAAHWRYPEALFRAQAVTYRTYHMTEPSTFYNAEDVWAIPTETMERSDTVAMQPYYITMRLRGEERQEFLLMLPFTPVRKQNMISWMAARSDPPHYGELVVYKFAKGQIVLGPQQIESRIDQEPEISAQLTLWSQSGSRAIRGNLLVIPIGDAIVYVEPLYLQAETSALPELKRVIVASGERVVMQNNLSEAVASLLGETPIVALEEGTEGPAEGEDLEEARDATDRADEIEVGETTDFATLVLQAQLRERAATEALAEGDWVAFGEEMAALQQVIDQLSLIVGIEQAGPAAAEEVDTP